jgi:nucleoside phosphorylase
MASTDTRQMTEPLIHADDESLEDFFGFLCEDRNQTQPAVEASIPECERLIFVATCTELAALKFAAKELGIAFSMGRGLYGEYYDLGKVGADRVLAIRTKMGPLLEKGSAARALQYRYATRANTIIGVGMAFGVDPDRQRLGEVLVATGILPYDTRTVKTADDGSPRVDYTSVDRYSSNKALRRHFEQFSQQPPWKGRVHRGLLLSGGARIHCASFRDELVRECGPGHGDPVVGGDMEGVGFLSASSRKKPSWIIVKGISDFADHNRKKHIEDARPVACYYAAKFVLSALRATEV